jgi:hypothetical protein
MLRVAIRNRTTGVVCGVAIAAAGLLLCSSPARAKQDKKPICAPSGAGAWGYVQGFKPFRIWYDEDAADVGFLELRAKYLVREMDTTIWPKLTASMNTTPKSKPLEICLVRNGQLPPDDLAITHPEGDTCAGAESWISIGEGAVGAEEKKALRDVLAHEFMHVLQFSLDVKCTGTLWWREATANWAMDEAYPDDNVEHDYAPAYLKDIGQPLPTTCDKCNREYGAYVFPFWIARSIRPGLIGSIWHSMEQKSTLDAIDDELPGGFKKQWPRFALDSWNQDPVDYYKSWDDLKVGASTYTKEQQLSPGSDVALQGVQDLQHLSAKYFTFKVAAGVRTVGVQIPWPYFGGPGGQSPDPHASVQAIVGLAGGSAEVQNWTGKGFKNYCFALPHQHVTSLTLIFANSDEKEDFSALTGTDPAYVIATNVGCKQWSGTITAELDNPHGDTGLKITSTAEVTYQRANSSPDGQVFYTPTHGGLNWKGTWETNSGGTSCSYSGSGSLEATPDSGEIQMYWGFHAAPGLFTPHSYSGSLGGPLLDVLDGKCSDGSMPLAGGALDAWFTGPDNVTVSANGLQMHGHYGENEPDGSYETWDWNLTSSG